MMIIEDTGRVDRGKEKEVKKEKGKKREEEKGGGKGRNRVSDCRGCREV